MVNNLELVLVCDLDGVIIDFDRGWCERRSVEPGQAQAWDELHLVGGFDSREDYWAWFYESGGFKGLPLYPGAKEALWMANDRGWFIIYATNRPGQDSMITVQALVHASLPQAHHVYVTQRKWEVAGDLYLEDAPGNIMAMMDMGCRVVPVERPWNQDLLHAFDPDGTIDGVTVDTLKPWLEAVEDLTQARADA